MLEFLRPTRARVDHLLAGVAPLLLLTTALPAQIWSEEFNTGGAPDPAVWSYDLGDSGWGNSELQNYTSDPSNVRVQDGHLILTARRNGRGFTSARIRSQDKLTFQYGTVEARIRVPDLGNGLWPAFWTLGNSISAVGWPDCGEIDVLEMGAGDAIANNLVNRRVYSTAHWEFNGSRALYGLSRTMPFDLDDEFHVWRMEWTPQAISTFIDGQWIWTMDISDPASFDGEEFHAPHFFIVNLAVGGNFTGILDRGGITAPLPAEYRVDYIRVFDNGHTILDGSAWNTPATRSTRTGAGNFNSALTCSPPVLGSTMTVFLNMPGQPYQTGGVVGYLGAASLPLDNFTLLIDPNSTPLLTLPLTPFVVAGLVGWSVPIPSDRSLAGVEINTQGVLAGPGLGLTNAVDLRLGF